MPSAHKSKGKRPAGPPPRTRPNRSILSYFKKIEIDESLFVESDEGLSKPAEVVESLFVESDDGLSQPAEVVESLFVESDDGLSKTAEVVSRSENGTFVDHFSIIESPQKRRRLSDQGGDHVFSPERALPLPQEERLLPPARDSPSTEQPKPRVRMIGPFVDDSDSDSDEERAEGKGESQDDGEGGDGAAPTQSVVAHPIASRADDPSPDAASQDPAYEFEFPDNGIGDMDNDHSGSSSDDDDLFGDKHAKLGEWPLTDDYDNKDDDAAAATAAADAADAAPVDACPICDASLDGLDADGATRHVNSCLDRPPSSDAPLVPSSDQERPSHAATLGTGAASAFAKLMSSGHAVTPTRAVIAAASAPAASASAPRGSGRRPCPFYKIMPGLALCVDAFRYGAVSGCRAYFLTHFHSDHYGGLTAGWSHGPIYCSRVTGALVRDRLRVAAQWVVELEFERRIEIPDMAGAAVTLIPANHCPGSAMFLFEKAGPTGRPQRILHCGDFRACPAHVSHPLLRPGGGVSRQTIDVCYLDTTYLDPQYAFPPQRDVIRACTDLCSRLSADPSSSSSSGVRNGRGGGSRPFFTTTAKPDPDPDRGPGLKSPHRVLFVCGTYLIGKERICTAVARALDTKIYAPPRKLRICGLLDDLELASLVTADPAEAQVHMQALRDVSPKALREYLDAYRPLGFTRVVGLRPSGWNYRPRTAAAATSVKTAPSAVPTAELLHGAAWRSRFGVDDLAPGRGSTAESSCYDVPYSEHSSFRELALFVMGLPIERVVPTVNVGSEASRGRMRGWVDRWMGERRRVGFVTALEEREGEGEEAEGPAGRLWGILDKDSKVKDSKDGSGGGAWW